MSASNEKKYFAFISYKREDEEWAKWLQHKLEHYKLPSNLNGRSDLPKEIRPIFKDTSELNPGNLPQQIHHALEQSRFLIVICSPRSAQSEWVNKEVETFMGMGRTDRIIPFIIDGKAFARNPDEECFPQAIRNLPAEQEILGANISEMGRDAAAVKVVAQMFGLKFDELWQRHEREQRRKRLLIIAGALLLALSGVAVAIGFSQQNKRIREQNERITKQNEDILNKNERLLNDSIVMAAQMDSINKRDVLILNQQDSLATTNKNLEIANEQLTTERNNLKATNWKMMENRARFLAEKASSLVEEGDSYTARRLLLAILPQDLDHPEKPYPVEVRISLIESSFHNSAMLKGHTDQICSIAFSPDGTRVVSTSNDKTIRIWDLETGKMLKMLEGHNDEVNTAAFSPDGKLIVSASKDSTVRIWDAATGMQLNNLKGHNAPLLSATFSPDGKSIISVSDMDSYIIWDTRTGRQIKKQDRYASDFAVFSPDGKFFATRAVGFTDNLDNVKIWDISSGSPSCKLEGHTSSVSNAAFSPDGRLIATGSMDNTIRIWEKASDEGVFIPLRVIEGHTRWVRSTAFSPDGKRIVSTSDDNTIRVWDVETGKQLKEFKLLHDPANRTAFCPDGNRVVSASAYDNTIKIWDLESDMKPIAFKDMDSKRVAFSPDGEKVLSVSYFHNIIVVYDAETGESLKVFHTSRDHYSAAFSPDGKKIIAELNDETFETIDAESGEQLGIKEWNLNDYRVVYRTTFNPQNAQVLYINPRDKSSFIIMERNKNGGKPIKDIIGGHTERINSTAFSPDGKYIATASDDKTIRIWDAETHKMLRIIRGHTLQVSTAIFSPDGYYIVSASRDQTVRVWDVKSGKQICILDTFEYQPTSVDFSPDGKHIAISSTDEIIHIWDFPTLQELIDQTRERFKDYPLTDEERRMYYLE